VQRDISLALRTLPILLTPIRERCRPALPPFINGINHVKMPFMDAKLTLDKAGRLVLPKPLRDDMRLTAGSELRLEQDEECIILRPIRSSAPLKKEQGIWVYQGQRSESSISKLIDEVREKRLREEI
jgi:AbrB family looped-hinge helix DNA binding protein